MNWIDSHSRHDDGIYTVGSSTINRLFLADDLELLPSSKQGFQHALDQFSAACIQTGMKVTEGGTRSLIHGLVKQTQFWVSFTALC